MPAMKYHRKHGNSSVPQNYKDGDSPILLGKFCRQPEEDRTQPMNPEERTQKTTRQAGFSIQYTICRIRILVAVICMNEDSAAVQNGGW